MSYQSRFLVAWLERHLDDYDDQGRMPLTRDQRQALFAGNLPKIIFDHPAPVKAGHVEVLSPKVVLTVIEVRRTKDGRDSLAYELRNDRLGSRFMARQDGQAHPEQYAYNAAAGIDKEAGECVDDFTQRRQTRAARERESVAKADLIAAAEEMLTSLKESEHPSARRGYWPLRRELDRFIQREKRRAA